MLGPAPGRPVMNEGDYRRYDATGLATLIARGGVTAAEVVETAIASIEALNPALNAVIAPLIDAARGEVSRGLPEGPLRGVPTACATPPWCWTSAPARCRAMRTPLRPRPARS